MSTSSTSSLVVSTAVGGYTIHHRLLKLEKLSSPSMKLATLFRFLCNGVESNPGVLVGHLPKEISRHCHYFTVHEGKICGEVSGPRQYSHALERGGLEIPCILTFTGPCKGEYQKVERAL